MSTYQKQSHHEYSDFPETPVAELRDPGDSGCHQISPMVFCDYHKLHAPLTPLPGRYHNPVDLLCEVSQGLAELRDLSESYMLKDIHGSSIPDTYVNGIHVLFGVTRMRETSKGMRYRNPNYVHYDERTVPIKDTERRLEFYERHKINPAADGRWLAKHWGYASKDCANTFLRRHGYNRRDDKVEAMKRIGRTALCIREWCGIPLDRLGKLLPWPFETVRDWASRFGLQADWNVPRDVREAPWFITSWNGSHKSD
jgi:hypothetical protein